MTQLLRVEKLAFWNVLTIQARINETLKIDRVAGMSTATLIDFEM